MNHVQSGNLEKISHLIDRTVDIYCVEKCGGECNHCWVDY
jgi:hypothetical protein